MEKLEPLCTVSRNIKWCHHCGKQYGGSLEKKNYSSNSTSGYIPPLKLETTVLRYLYTHVHGSIIHNSQNMDTNPVFINQLMDYQNVVCSYNRILFGLKKGREF